VATLRNHRKRQLERRLLTGSEWLDGGFVFTGGIGTTLDPYNLALEFNTPVRQSGLPEIRFHDL